MLAFLNAQQRPPISFFTRFILWLCCVISPVWICCNHVFSLYVFYLNSSFVDLFSFNFIVDVSNAPEMQGDKLGVVKHITLISTNGNAIFLLHLLKTALDILLERQLTCFFRGSKVDGCVALHGWRMWLPWWNLIIVFSFWPNPQTFLVAALLTNISEEWVLYSIVSFCIEKRYSIIWKWEV